MESKYILFKYLKSQYVTPYLSSRLREFLEQCEKHFNDTGSKVTVDITNCKFHPDNSWLIPKFSSKVNFTSSDNKFVEFVLDHNSRVEQTQELIKRGVIFVRNIPTKFEVKEISQYLRDIDDKYVYRLCSFNEFNGTVPDISILIAMAIACLYPNVKVDLGDQIDNYFRIFKRFWSYTGRVHREKYHLKWYGNVIDIECTGKDEFGNYFYYVPTYGNITEDSLNDLLDVIPFEFGEVEDLSNDLELKNIYDSICDELMSLIKARKTKKKLTSELTLLDK